MIKKGLIVAVILIATAIILAGCEDAGPAGFNSRISHEQAIEIMATNEDTIILDVRTLDEFNTGHIPDAVSLPLDEIEAAAPHMMPDLGQTILIYCRSGVRSADAAVILVDMGYRNVFDFGGIIDWTGEVVTPSH